MKGLCEDWASAVDGIEHTSDLQKATLSVFFSVTTHFTGVLVLSRVNGSFRSTLPPFPMAVFL